MKYTCWRGFMDYLAFIDGVYCTLVYLLPTKKNLNIKEKIQLLKKEKEFVRLKTKFGPSFLWNIDVRNFIFEQPLERISKNGILNDSFFQDLEIYCAKVGL
jgi:hypothetical protein